MTTATKKPARRTAAKPRAKVRKKTAAELTGQQQANDAAAVTTMQVNVKDVRPSPHQNRQTFDADELQKLADSIRTHGLIQKPVVRLVDGSPELVAGERRWRAVQLLKWQTMPVEIRALDDGAAADITIAENLDRVDLSPFEEAHGFESWLQLTGKTQTDCGARFGKTQGHIANRLRLLKLNDDWRQLVEAKRITIRQARVFPGK